MGENGVCAEDDFGLVAAESGEACDGEINKNAIDDFPEGLVKNGEVIVPAIQAVVIPSQHDDVFGGTQRIQAEQQKHFQRMLPSINIISQKHCFRS